MTDHGGHIHPPGHFCGSNCPMHPEALAKAEVYKAALDLACADMSGTAVEAGRLRDGYLRAALRAVREGTGDDG